MKYGSAARLLPDLAARIGPPIRRSVSETARAVVKVKSAGGSIDSWDHETTPYMLEPMNMLESRARRAVVFIGPAQSGKTQALIDCWLAHVATASASDMMILQATQGVARDFESMRIRPLLRNSEAIRARFGKSGHDNNTYDKRFVTGDTLLLGWPSENVLQGKPLRRVALTDYDRMPDNIGGQGSPYDLAYVRGRRFRSLAMTLVESSPGREQTDPQWQPANPHQAPPATGIFSLYNLGDMRRYYWPCPECGEHYMQPPGPDGFHYHVDRDLLGDIIPESLRDVAVICSACGALITEDRKPQMLQEALWVPAGCRIEAGRVVGTPRASEIASYWLHGAHAAFQPWYGLLLAYLQAQHIYDTTGSEESLRTRVMQDWAAPYISQSRKNARTSADIEARAEVLAPRTVPAGVRFLQAAVDIQKNRFVVQVIGHGRDRERWLIDRYDIHASARTDHTGQQRPVDPSVYPEDWDLITERVICSSYPLVDAPHKRLNIRVTVCDSGGRGGVTRRAYDYYRLLRRQRLAHRFALVKGVASDPTKSRQPTVAETYPDNTARADRHSGARGDVPVYLLHVNELKDTLDADLQRETPGQGYLHIPRWITAEQPNWYRELTAEIRTEKGWEPADRSQARNESWDLLVYDAAATLIPQDQAGIVQTKQRRAHHATPAARIDWDRPPVWAGPLEHNSEVDAVISPTEIVPTSARAKMPPRRPRGGSWTTGWK